MIRDAREIIQDDPERQSIRTRYGMRGGKLFALLSVFVLLAIACVTCKLVNARNSILIVSAHFVTFMKPNKGELECLFRRTQPSWLTWCYWHTGTKRPSRRRFYCN